MHDPATHEGPAGTAGQPTVLGDYQLGPHVARRAVADVYEAVHAPSGGARRVYVLRPGAMHDNPLVHRVVCEADAARWLRHSAAAKLEAHGDTPSRRLYVAVEHPDGRPLDAAIAAAGRLAPRRVVRVAGRLVEALDEAHAVGLVHGRLTPSAAVVAYDADGADAGGAPVVTLTGLGTAAIDGADPVAPGDRPYVSPEQLAGREPDVRSDVFGLASLLQYALTGAVPADGDDAPPAGADDGAGEAVHAVLARARSTDPRRRPATVKAFWEDLLEALVADGVRATGASVAATATVTATDTGAAEPPHAIPAAPVDERAALAHLELADFAAAAPAPAVDAAAAPAAPTAPPALEFGGVDVTVAPSSGAPRRPMPPRWASARPAHAPAAAAPRPAAPAGGAARSARPRRRARTLLVYAWWLAVPAVAAAVGWPITRTAAHAADREERPAPGASPGSHRGSTPPVLATATATRRAAARLAGQSAAGTLVRRDADASGVADAWQLADSGAAQVDLPAVEVSGAAEPPAPAPAARVLVRPDEFSTRIRIPGAP